MAFLGALVTVALALPVGILLARYPGRRTGVLEHLAYAGHALPGIVVGLGLVFFALSRRAVAVPDHRATRGRICSLVSSEGDRRNKIRG